MGFQGRLLTPWQWRSHQRASEAGACTHEQDPKAKALLPAKSLERPLLTRLMPVKGKIFPRPRSVFSADKKLNLKLSQSISWNTIGLGMLLAFSECGQGMLYPAVKLVPHEITIPLGCQEHPYIVGLR